MKQAGATCLAIDAGRCLLLEGDGVVEAANQAGIAIASSTQQSALSTQFASDLG